MNNFTIKSNKITMYSSGSNSISVSNGKIIINGVDVTESVKEGCKDQKEINIYIDGPVDKIETESANVLVTGDVNSVSTQSGDVDIENNINGSVSTMSGDVKVSGDIHGSVSTMSGDIKRR